eukprot:m.194967 g.194967  ORF g.194967 m.194967 type:complete len:327 (-) comp32543_c10_seq3:816-1796(-)
MSTPAPPPPPPPPPSTVPASEQPANVEQPQPPQMPEMPEPGPWDGLGREAAEVLFYPNMMSEGLRFQFNRPCSENMQASHKIVVGDAKESGYTFSPTFVGTHKNEGSPQGFPVLMGSIDTSGNLVSQIVHEPLNGLTTKFSGQTQGAQWMGAQVEVGYSGSDYTSSLTFANPNPIARSGIVVATYLQKLSKSFAAGAEYVYQSAQGQEQPALSGALRYRTDTNTFLAKFSPTQMNLNMSYHHKLDMKTVFATDLMVDAGRNIAQANFGWQANYRTAVFKGQVTTNGEVAAMLEQDIIPQVMGISFNAVLDHFKGDAKFGLGFILNS